ncbi:hypothetical protein CNEO4_580034 [Clostridium neonatale]|uniref:Uncharacterized protein n=1 Tax=Clostridium neonatale TaxID=137838 RepID=A0AAD2DF51_9CLOT|nr:hypothetical protein CNEO2_20072 [Clostridium neonatale]CAI3204145.1 hypothetical protein CNEO2_30087 [Clostridium neonatale]CAI3205945.1 hypothetical protein CNEO2_20010 [Clostridium neonatale]CAI3232237.1 hypothetical protein CNEO2_10104 [Clostridium neonatale]CAI3248533.1 hypothetical protein CNEO2_90008 [Clostridium neonatale]
MIPHYIRRTVIIYGKDKKKQHGKSHVQSIFGIGNSRTYNFYYWINYSYDYGI